MIEIYNQIGIRLSPGADASVKKPEIARVLEMTSWHHRQRRRQRYKQYLRKYRPVQNPKYHISVDVCRNGFDHTKHDVQLVENQRGQIGVQGPRLFEGKFLWHYTSYGVYMGGLGALTGF